MISKERLIAVGFTIFVGLLLVGIWIWANNSTSHYSPSASSRVSTAQGYRIGEAPGSIHPSPDQARRLREAARVNGLSEQEMERAWIQGVNEGVHLNMGEEGAKTAATWAAERAAYRVREATKEGHP